MICSLLLKTYGGVSVMAIIRGKIIVEAQIMIFRKYCLGMSSPTLLTQL
jgi:hypothetical protein